VTHHRHHVVAVTAQGPGVDVLNRNAGGVGQEVGEAARIQNAGHAHDLLARQARKLAQGPDHGVQRIGDADDEGVGGMGLDALTDGLHHLQIDRDQIVAAHARLARHPGGDDADVGPGDVGIVVRALERHVGIEDGGGLRDIQRLALGGALGNVEQHHIAQLLAGGDVSQGAADHAGADEGDLGTSHLKSCLSNGEKSSARGLAP
jgi:hypothetical protein